MRKGLRVNVLGALATAMLLSGATLPESPVADAAMRGEIETVRALVKQGADVNAAQGDGMTALHWAAEKGDAQLADVLIYAGANLRAVTRLGDHTALHLASRSGHADVAKRLIDAGADVKAVTRTGATPLHFAARAGNAEIVQALAAKGADVNAREGAWEQTPLMFAAAYDRVDAVKALVAAGADVGLRSKVLDIPNVSAIDRAAGQVRDQVLQSFREKSANPDTWRPSPAEVQAAVRAGIEVQRTGVVPGGQQVAATQFQGGVAEGPSGGTPAQGGLTALLHAVREGNTASALALVDAGADINQTSGGDNTSPMLMAALNGHNDLLLTLLERGADPNVVSRDGAAPLYIVLNTYWAPRSRYPQQQAHQFQNASYLQTMEALLKAGADPNARLTSRLWYMEFTFAQLDLDETGATPFFRAAFATDVEAMRLLAAHGADPNKGTIRAAGGGRGRRGGAPREDPSGLPPFTGGEDVFPIHAATGHAYGAGFAGNSHRHAPDAWLASVKYLVEEMGADVNQRDGNGNTPLHNAAARGDNDVILYLIEKGADVMAVNRNGQTTVDMANGPAQRLTPFPKTIALLEGLGAINNHNCLGC